MEVLPTETLSQIFEYLTPLDILNLPFNISTQGLSIIQAQRQFSDIRVRIGESALNSLIRISNHPSISQCVDIIVFQMPNLQTGGCAEQKLAAHTGSRDSLIRPMDIDRLKHVFKRFSGLRLLKIDTDVATLNVGLARDLSEARYSGHELHLGHRCVPLTAHRAPSRTLCKPNSMSLSTSKQCMTWTVLLSLAAADVQPQSIDCYDRSHYRDRPETAKFLSLLHDSVPSRPILGTYSHLKNLRWSCNSIQAGTLARRDLSLDLRLDKEPFQGAFGTMQLICSSAARLETLSISCFGHSRINYVNNGNNPILPLKSLFGSNEARHLVMLDLDTVRVQEKELSGCLNLCATTLKTLGLEGVHIYSGSWLFLFQTLKGRFPEPKQGPPITADFWSLEEQDPCPPDQRKLSLHLDDLSESSPEGSQLIHYNGPITLAAFQFCEGKRDEEGVDHVLDWLHGRTASNPYWIKDTGAPRFKPLSNTPRRYLQDLEGYKPLYAPGYDNNQQTSSSKETSEE